MTGTRRWRACIIALSVFSALLSIACVLILVTRADAIFLAINEPLFTGVHPPHPLSADTRMAQCIGFGLFAGWSVSLAWAYASVPDVALRPLSRALIAGLAVWFVLDSGGCILSGAAWNAVPNTLYLAGMLVPSIALARRRA